jgi:hypothetical protein
MTLNRGPVRTEHTGFTSNHEIVKNSLSLGMKLRSNTITLCYGKLLVLYVAILSSVCAKNVVYLVLPPTLARSVRATRRLCYH